MEYLIDETAMTATPVWEFRLGPDLSVYRAERITPPLVSAISR